MSKPVAIRAFLTAGLCLLARAALEARADDKPDSRGLFTASAYISHVKYLASDELGGRFPGTPGIERAAEYIAEQFKAAGCLPAGQDGTYFQTFEARGAKRLLKQQAELELRGIDAGWELGADWIPLPFSRPGRAEGPLAFAGYGIEAPEYGYDDYADFDAQGKVLLIFRFEPRAEDPQAEFGGKNPSRHATFRRKARVARQHGAKALLIVNPSDRPPEGDRLFEFKPYWARQTHRLPMVHIKRCVAEALLEGAGLPDLDTLQQLLEERHEPLSSDLPGLHVRLDTGLKYVQTRNVLGMLPGDGSSDEIIVIGAHYDHEGVRPPMRGSNHAAQIHNGADDNASGTAGVIELARAFGQLPRTRRNLLFIAFSAEELGLLGSKYFVEHPTVPLERIKAMINLDMIGRLSRDKFQIFGARTAREFADILARAAQEVGIHYRLSQGMVGRSDHASFRRKHIPVLFAFTGMHKQYTMPADDWELIDARGGAKVVRLMYRVTEELANMDAAPQFVSAEQEQPRAAAGEEQRPGAKQRPAEREAGTPRRPRVRLGIMPDLAAADDQAGLRVEAVIEGGPAQRAGMQDGDLIVTIAGQQVGDIYDYMDALRDRQPGQQVEVVVRRGGQEVKLTVKLETWQRRAMNR